jgi:hypothetical protein
MDSLIWTRLYGLDCKVVPAEWEHPSTFAPVVTCRCDAWGACLCTTMADTCGTEL